MIQTLKAYQAWRRGDDERTLEGAGLTPAKIGEAIDWAIGVAEERDALKSQLSGKADIANQLKDGLTDAFERELSLKAQVEQLRTVIDALVFGADRKFIDGEMTYMIPANHIISIGKAFGKEPAQCLAEVRAQAGRDGYQACVDALGEAAQNAMDNGDTSLIGCIGELESYTTILDAEYYANQLRRQAEG